MVKKLIFILTALLILQFPRVSVGMSERFSLLPDCEETHDGKHKLVDNLKDYFSTDYWRYSNGTWLDGARIETAIHESGSMFWEKPELFYDRPGMQINLTVPIPDEVKEFISSGGEVTIVVKPQQPEAINSEFEAFYQYDDNNVYIQAKPLFLIDNSKSYTDQLPDISKCIPFVADGYGWNLYSMYKGRTHIGAAESVRKDNKKAIELEDIVDVRGRLKPGKTISIFNPDKDPFDETSEDILIGDGTFNSGGSVGMWFNYWFELEFYGYGIGDLEVISHKPDSVKAGEMVKSKIKIRNNSDCDYSGGKKAQLNFWDGTTTHTVDFSIGANEEKEVTVDWKAPLRNEIIETVVNINPDHKLPETDYDNNKKKFPVKVIKDKEKPDFAVIGHRLELSKNYVSEYYPGGSGGNANVIRKNTAVTSYIMISNNSEDDFKDVEFEFNDGGNVFVSVVSLKAWEEKEIAVEWFTPERNGAITVSAHINPKRMIEESDYANNRGEYEILIEDGRIDLSVGNVMPSKYEAGKQVVTLVEVKNDSDESFDGDRLVDVTLSIPAVGYKGTKRIAMAPGDEQNVPFSWTAPKSTGNFKITAEINASREISEINYSNNTVTIDATTIKTANPTYGCDTVRRVWTEKRFSHTRQARMKIGDTVYQYQVSVYKDVDFYAEVSMKAVLLPGTMKSGYGVECEVTTSISTDYDRPDEIMGLQSVYAYLPTSGFNEAIELERVPGTDNKWRFPVNQASVKGNRVAYVPVEWPDNSYFTIGFTGRDAYSPGGAMCASVNADVYINGNMYSDDSTNPTN